MNFDERLEDFERRLSILENGHGLNGETGDKTIELDLTLPEVDIGGLHFNETKVHAVFEKQDDGWYYSRDIMLLSARNMVDENSRDILMEYLNLSGDDGLREQLAYNIGIRQHGIEISLPKKNQGIKKYNGVRCWYWLADPYPSSAANFCGSSINGTANYNFASAVGGCAPAFCVRKEVLP
jgi:hypothetical protein